MSKAVFSAGGVHPFRRLRTGVFVRDFPMVQCPFLNGYAEPILADLIGAFLSLPVRDAVPAVAGGVLPAGQSRSGGVAGMGWQFATGSDRPRSPARAPAARIRLARTA